MMRPRRNIPALRDQVLRLKRTCYVFTWTPSTTTTNDFWRYLGTNLSSMTNSSDITNLFDQYRITGLKYTFRPRSNSFDGANNTDTTLPGITNNPIVNVHVVNDPYSTVTSSGTYTSTNLNTFLEQGNVKSYTGLQPFSIFFRPTVFDQIDGATAQKKRAPWLLTSQPAVNHYGIHVFMQDPNLSGIFAQSFDVFLTYYVQAKGFK